MEGASRFSRLPFDPGLAGLWLLFFVPPVALLPGIADSFRLPKLVTSETLALLACALLLSRRALARRDAPLRPLAWLRSPALRATLPLVAVALVGLAVSAHDVFVRRTLPSFLAGVVFLWCVAACTTSRERWRLLRAWTIPAVLLALLGLLQALDVWEPLGLLGGVSERMAVTSLAGGAFDLAAYLLLPALLAQERALRTSGRRRLAWGVAGAILAACLLATQTVAVLAAFLAGVTVFWWMVLPRRRALQAVAAIVVLAIAALALVGPLRSRVAKKVEQLADGEINAVLTGRLDGWHAALWMAGEEPWTGVGLGAYRAEFGKARIELQDQGATFFGGHRQPYFVNAHSDPLEALAEWGIPGLLAVLWGAAIVFRRAVAPGGVFPGDRAPEGRASLLPAFVAAMTVVTLTNFPFRLALLAYPWLVVLAEIFAPAEGEEKTMEEEAALGGPALPARPVGLVVALLLLAATIFVFDRGRDRVGAERLVRMAESVVIQGSQAGGLPPRALSGTLDLLRRARALDPAQVSVPVTRGGIYLLAGRWGAAERSYHRALELEYRPEIWANLARVHLGAGDRDAALAAGRRAVRLNPRVAKDLPALPELRELARQVRRGHALEPTSSGSGS